MDTIAIFLGLITLLLVADLIASLSALGGVKFLVEWHSDDDDDTEKETAKEMTPFEKRFEEVIAQIAKQVNANGCGLDRIEEELEKAIGVLTVIAIPPPVAPTEAPEPKPAKKPRKRLNDPQGKLALHFPQASELKVQWNATNSTAELYSTDNTTGGTEEVTVWATMPWRRNKKGFRADYAWQKFAKLLLASGKE